MCLVGDGGMEVGILRSRRLAQPILMLARAEKTPGATDSIEWGNTKGEMEQ